MTTRKDEARMHLECRSKWLLDLIKKATTLTEWDRADIDAVWTGSSDNLAIKVLLELLSVKSPAYPDGWTPRREGEKEAKQIAKDVASFGIYLLNLEDKSYRK